MDNGYLGTVIPSATLPGDYTFTYTLPAPSGSTCLPADVSVKLTVLAPPVFNFAPPVCTANRLTYDVNYTVNDATEWDINFRVVNGGNQGNTTVDTGSSRIVNIPSGTEIELIVTDKLTVGATVNQNFLVPFSDCPCDTSIPDPTVVTPSVTVCENDSPEELSVTVPTGVGLTARWYLNVNQNLTFVGEGLSYVPQVTSVSTHTYTVKTYNPVSICESVGVDIEYQIFGIRPVDLEPQKFLCVDANGIATTPLIIESESRTGFTYQWYNSDGEMSGETDNRLFVNSPGTYFVIYESTTVNSVTGMPCDVISSETIVTPIVEPVLLPLSLGAEGFAKFNSITATLENGGDPNSDYEYDLDGDVFQSSNVFENVSTGFHTVTVTDRNSCGSDSQEIFVIGFPKFFTPNGIGPTETETWNVDLNPNQPMDISIFIYDRFGKLIKQVFPDKSGWDGTFAGKDMPSDDYWFLATMNDTGATYSSHFTLVR